MNARAILHPLDTSNHPAHDDAVDPQELAAVKAAMNGELLARIKLGAKALRAILKDPNDTKQVFTLFMTVNAKQIPRFLARFVAEPGGIELLYERPAIDSRSVDFEALGRLPADTLGGAFARHLSERGLSPDIFKAPPGIPVQFAFLGQRMRQSHDIWHVIAGYDTTVDDELALLAFSHGQSQMPGPAVLAIAGAIRFFPKYPGIFKKVIDGFRRGKAAKPLFTARWEDMWAMPLAEVRQRFGVPPRA